MLQAQYSLLDIKSNISLGIQKYQVGKYTEAIQSFTNVLNLDEKNLEAKVGLGKSYIKEKDYDKAEVVLEEVLKIAPENNDGRKAFAKLFLNIADSYSTNEDTRYDAVLALKKGYSFTNDLTIKSNLDQLLQNLPGNSTTNILNDGYVAKQGDWIYYTDFNDSKYLYKTKADSQEKIKLSNEMASSINVIISPLMEQNIRGISDDLKYTDSRNKNDISFHYLNEIGDKIYYVCHEKMPEVEIPNSYIVTLNSDGTGEKKLNLIGDPYYISIYKDWIYY